MRAKRRGACLRSIYSPKPCKVQLDAFAAGVTESSKEGLVDAIKLPEPNTEAVSMKTNIPVKVMIKKRTTPTAPAVPAPVVVTSEAWRLYSQFMAPRPPSSYLIHTPPSSPAMGPMRVQETRQSNPGTPCDDLDTNEEGEEDAPPTNTWSNARIASNILPHLLAARHIPPVYRYNPDMFMSILELRSGIPYGEKSVLRPGGAKDEALYSELSSDSDASWLESMALGTDE